MKPTERKPNDATGPEQASSAKNPHRKTAGASADDPGVMEKQTSRDAPQASSTGDKDEIIDRSSSSNSSYSDGNDIDRPSHMMLEGVPIPITYLDASEADHFKITKESLLPLKMAERAKFDQMREDRTKLYQKLLDNHKLCCRDGQKKCSLEQHLQALDSEWGVPTETSDHQEITGAISQLVKFVADEVSRREPALQCRVIPMGSSFSRLKVGRLDEFDFMLELMHIRCGQEGTEIVADSDSLHEDDDDDDSVADSDDDISGFEGCHRILVSSPQQLTRFQAYLDESKGGHSVSAGKIKSKFEGLVTDVLSEVRDSLCSGDAHDSIQTYIGESISHLLKPKVSDGPLCIRLRKLKHPVKVDMTPCIKWEDKGDEEAYLVPSWAFDTWQKANKLPSDLDPHIKKAVRASKIVRDMCDLVQGERSSCEQSGPVYLVMKKQRKDYTLLEDTTKEIMTGHYYGQWGLLHSALVSYGLLGTLIKHFKTDTPLCRLVLSAFGEHEDIDPKGRPLLKTQYDKNRSDAKCLASLQALKKLDGQGSDTDAFIRAHIPLWYFADPPSLDTLLTLSQKTPVESFTVNVKTEDPSLSPEKQPLKVNVYSVGVEDFRYVLTKLHYVPDEDDDSDEDGDEEEEENDDEGDYEESGVEHELSKAGEDALFILVVPDRGLFEMDSRGTFRLAKDLAELGLPQFVQTLVSKKWSITPNVHSD